MYAPAPIVTNETDLIASAQAGYRPAFDDLFARYYTRINLYLLRRTGDPELAADLTQQTFLDAFHHFDRWTGDRPFAAWLYRIARNNLLHEQRRQHHRPAISLDQLVATPKAESVTVRHADDTACHERTIIQYILTEISPKLRRALLLNSLNGFDSQEVAVILGISPETARQRISRAKKVFRSRYHQINAC